MIRSPEELSKPIKEAVNSQSIMLSFLVLIITMSIYSIFTARLAAYQVIGIILVNIIVGVLVVMKFFDLLKVNKHPREYIVGISLLIFFTFSFLTEPASPYTLCVFVLLLLSNLYFGKKGVLVTIGVLGAASLVKFVLLSVSTDMSLAGRSNILITFIIFTAISIIFYNIQKIYDWDRAQLRETIKEAVIEQKRLRALVNNMTESVLVLDREGIIRMYNAAALALFNTNNSLSDKPLDGFIKLEDEKGKIITVMDLLPKDSKPIFRDDILLRYSQEDTASLSIVSTPIRSTFGQERDEQGYVITMRDITREKSLEEERDEFISVISHELRTPVTVAEAGVSNALLLSQKVPGNEKITKSLQTAHDQSVYLANMLNDLTTFARAEKGTLDMNLELFSPRDLLERLCEDYKTGVEAKGMHIAVEIDPSTPLQMASNRLYIREILQNFTTNAIKYSDKGTISLKARAKDKGILYTVADQGIGISVSDQKKIFEKFYRTEDYRTRSTNGTGLGLYIVKKLAKILDASFEVRSEVGKGSAFSLYVPDKSDVLDAKKAANAAPVSTTHVPVHTVAAPAATQPSLPVAQAQPLPPAAPLSTPQAQTPPTAPAA